MTENPNETADVCLRRIDAMRRELDQLGFEIRALANWRRLEAEEPQGPVSGPRAAAREDFLTIRQAVAEFPVSRKWLQVNWKKVPGAGKLGRKQVMIPRAGLMKFMQTCRDND